jgi:hypothetical protein
MNKLTVFIPKEKGNIKYTTRGFWKDRTKIYYDYLELRCIYTDDIEWTIANLRKAYNQLAIFYIQGDNAYIASEKGTIKLFGRLAITVRDRKLLRFYIKQFLQRYDGCTVYTHGKEYEIESWTI